jgi:hypothetical protein
MRVRALLTLTAVLSAILGAVVVYLFLSVPNDLRADGLLREARKDLEARKNDEAREKLSRIVQQYPRTDAAAAATVALVTIGQSDRKRFEQELASLRAQNAEQTKLITDLQKGVQDIRNAPPKVVTVTVPAPKPAPPKKVAPKKKTTPKKSNRRRR